MIRFERIAVFAFVLALVAPQAALANDAPAPATGAVSDAMMKGLAKHSQSFEEMAKRGAFTFSFHIEQVADDGKASEVTDVSLRSTPVTTEDRVTKIFKYVTDGKDKTAEMQKKADERRAKPKKESKEKSLDLNLPFLPSEQGRYIFSIAERDPANATRVRVNFNPKQPAENAIKGSAWVDETKNELLSMGFSLSKNPTFVDHVDVTVVFGLTTPLGPAPSKINFEVRGGFLIIHRKYRGTATFSDPVLAI